MSNATSLKKLRQKARKAALQAFYACDIDHDWQAARYKSILLNQETPLATESLDYALLLFDVLSENRDRIDQVLEDCSPKWNLERLGVLERCILRQASAELIANETPRLVVITESVRLAQEFTNQDAAKLVHAILDHPKLTTALA